MTAESDFVSLGFVRFHVHACRGCLVAHVDLVDADGRLVGRLDLPQQSVEQAISDLGRAAAAMADWSADTIGLCAGHA